MTEIAITRGSCGIEGSGDTTSPKLWRSGLDNPTCRGGAGRRALRARQLLVVDPLAVDARRRRHAGLDPQAAATTRRPTLEPRPTDAVPYAELHCHSNFSFLDGASHPEELAEEAVRLGPDRARVTDHDGFYGVVRFAEAARALEPADVFGAELSLGLPGPQNGEPDPAGAHLLVLARGPEGYARLSTRHRRGPAARRGEGPPGLRPGEASPPQLRGPRAGAHRLPQGARCPPALLTDGRRRGRPRARPADRAVRRASNVAVELTDHGDPTDGERNDALAALAARGRAADRRHQQRPLRRRRRGGGWPPRWPRSGPGAAWTRSTAGCPPPATAHLRSGAEMARPVRRLPGCGGHAAADSARELAFDLQLVAPQAARLPGPDPGTPRWPGCAS